MELERVRRLEGLFADHAQAVRAYALRRVDPSTADDIVSEVFVVAFRRLDEVPNEPVPWLLATVRRVLANHRRAAGRREGLTAQLTVLHARVWRDEITDEPDLQRATGASQPGQRSRPATRSASTSSGSTIIANTLTPSFPGHSVRLARPLVGEQGQLVLEEYQTRSRRERTTARW